NVPLVDAKSFAVEIRMECYKPYTASGPISPGQNVVINAALSPLVQPTTTKSPLSVVPVIAALSHWVAIGCPDEKTVRPKKRIIFLFFPEFKKLRSLNCWDGG
ncbi:MAG: hypothetical protein WCB46_08120, partial [Methanoregula sp.]